MKLLASIVASATRSGSTWPKRIQGSWLNLRRPAVEVSSTSPAGSSAIGNGAGAVIAPGSTGDPGKADPFTLTSPPQPRHPRRFHGSVSLDATRVGRDAGRIADEVISHLAGLVGADVEVTVEIQAEVPNGVPDKVVRELSRRTAKL